MSINNNPLYDEDWESLNSGYDSINHLKEKLIKGTFGGWLTIKPGDYKPHEFVHIIGTMLEKWPGLIIHSWEDKGFGAGISFVIYRPQTVEETETLEKELIEREQKVQEHDHKEFERLNKMYPEWFAGPTA